MYWERHKSWSSTWSSVNVSKIALVCWCNRTGHSASFWQKRKWAHPCCKMVLKSVQCKLLVILSNRFNVGSVMREQPEPKFCLKETWSQNQKKTKLRSSTNVSAVTFRELWLFLTGSRETSFFWRQRFFLDVSDLFWQQVVNVTHAYTPMSWSHMKKLFKIWNVIEEYKQNYDQ